MRSFMTLIILLFLSAFGAAAFAGDESDKLIDARQLYDTGKYDQAIALLEDEETAEALSLTAEIISAKVMLGYFEKPRKAATRARKLADKARELAPDLPEVHVQYALARGFETQSSSPFRAWRKNLIPKSKKAIKKVQADSPDDPRGDALMGAWHLGIVRKAGHGRADDLFNATEEDGIRFYEASLEKAPADLIILSNFTAVLMSIDAEKHLERGMALLKRIDKAEPKNAVEKEVKAKLVEMVAHSDDPEKLKALADALLGDENDDEDDE